VSAGDLQAASGNQTQRPHVSARGHGLHHLREVQLIQTKYTDAQTIYSISAYTLN
jgi:hypothetical protein